MNTREADTLLETLSVWEQRHQPMSPAQRCTTDPFDETACVDDYFPLTDHLRWLG